MNSEKAQVYMCCRLQEGRQDKSEVQIETNTVKNERYLIRQDNKYIQIFNTITFFKCRARQIKRTDRKEGRKWFN